MARVAATVTKDQRLELPETVRVKLEPGQVIDIDLPGIDESANLGPNLAMQAALEKIAKNQIGRKVSDGSQTMRFLREGRDGGIYGFEPDTSGD